MFPAIATIPSIGTIATIPSIGAIANAAANVSAATLLKASALFGGAVFVGTFMGTVAVRGGKDAGNMVYDKSKEALCKGYTHLQVKYSEAKQRIADADAAKAAAKESAATGPVEVQAVPV